MAAPKNFEGAFLSGVLACQQGRLNDAVELLSRARKVNPKSHACALRLGHALIGLGRAREAEAHLRSAVQVRPDFAEGWDGLAYWFKTQDRLKEAIECHEKCVQLQPDFAAGWCNYGLTLSLFGENSDALKAHERALAIDPGNAMARYGRAQALQQTHRIKEAVEDYGKFLAMRPEHHEARSYRLFALHYLEGVSKEELFAEHVAYGRAVGAPRAPELSNTPDPERKLRVAILSPDLRAHSCAYFLEPLVRHLDRSGFELLLYHDHFREDSVTQRLRALASVWRNFVGQPAAVVEASIRADGPDILVDLAGHTGMSNRLPLFARRLAPVQVTYLGYPNTTGLPAMDYRFTDGVADPEGEGDKFATERLVRFAPTAWCYQPPDGAPEVNTLPCGGGRPVTFGCFNNLAKITDTMLAVWGRVLHAVPDSRLVLKGRGLGDATVAAECRSRCARLGVPAERVDLLERTAETASHLALYHQVDLALDTFPYHGTTTTCEALWMGVPVVSLAGDRHMSRVGASLLTAVNHPEWIGKSEDDYVRIASGLAGDRTRLAAVRAELRADLARSALLDRAGQAAHFGAALRTCWLAWCTHPTSPTPEANLAACGRAHP